MNQIFVIDENVTGMFWLALWLLLKIMELDVVKENQYLTFTHQYKKLFVLLTMMSNVNMAKNSYISLIMTLNAERGLKIKFQPMHGRVGNRKT
jgi:hypothetical protein